jgi:hypothetical protein
LLLFPLEPLTLLESRFFQEVCDMARTNLPLVNPQAIDMNFDFLQWEMQLQQVANEIRQLQVLPTQNLELSLLRDQYATKSQELLDAVRRWLTAAETPQKNRAFQLMSQKYAILNSLWLQIAALSRRMA